MILVDTSVWIDHFRREDEELGALLDMNAVLSHELVIEELACGHIPNRSETIALLRLLPLAPRAEHDEILRYVDSHKIVASGIGCVDVNLLASASLSGASILTHDKALRRVASKLRLLHGLPAH